MIPSICRSSDLYIRLRHLRNKAVILTKRLADVEPTAYVHPTSHVQADLKAGPYVFIGRNCTIAPRVTIDRYTMLASNVAIVGGDHDWTSPGVPIQFSGRPPQLDTTLGADVWLGHGVTVMRGVTIGDGAVVGAGAVVTKDVPAYEIWAGVPAAKIGQRYAQEKERAVHEAMLAGTLLSPVFVEPQPHRVHEG